MLNGQSALPIRPIIAETAGEVVASSRGRLVQSCCDIIHWGLWTLRTGSKMTETVDRGNDQSVEQAQWNPCDWHGKTLIHCAGETIGKLQDVYVDVETDKPQFATVKKGVIDRHLSFVPLVCASVGREDVRVTTSKERIRIAPSIQVYGEELSQADEAVLYHHFEMEYTPIDTESGRRLARR